MRTHFSVSRYNLLHYWSSVHLGPGQLKGVRRPQSVGSPIPDNERASGSVLGKTSVPLVTKVLRTVGFLRLGRGLLRLREAQHLRKRKVYTKKEYQSELRLIMCYAKELV